MSNFPPCTPFARQQAMASRRAQGSIGPEDSVSAVSWSVVHEGQQGGSTSGQPQGPGQSQSSSQAQASEAPPPGFAPAGPAYGMPPGQTAQADTDSDEAPPADFTGGFAQPSTSGHAQQFPAAAPATQAARQVLGWAQKQAEKLAAQKARAKKRGGRGVKWVQMPGANAQNCGNCPHSFNSWGPKRMSARSSSLTSGTRGSSHHTKVGCWTKSS